MQKSLVRKGLVLGIIVLFVGASVISTNAGVTKNSIKQTNTQIESEEYPNFVGTIYVTWNNLYYEPLKNFRPNVTIVPVPIEERHYNFPADENNMVRFNFSAKLVVEQIKFLTLPRLTLAGWGHWKDGDTWHAESLFPPIIVWLNNHINPKTYDIYWEDELERNTNGAKNMTLFVHLEGYGFPFGFLGIIYEDINVTAHFTYPSPPGILFVQVDKVTENSLTVVSVNPSNIPWSAIGLRVDGTPASHGMTGTVTAGHIIDITAIAGTGAYIITIIHIPTHTLIGNWDFTAAS